MFRSQRLGEAAAGIEPSTGNIVGASLYRRARRNEDVQAAGSRWTGGGGGGLVGFDSEASRVAR